MRYLKIFWPPIIYTIGFSFYTLLLQNAYVKGIGHELQNSLIENALLLCYCLVFLGLAQLIYGLFNFIKNKKQHFLLHVISACLVFFIFGLLICSFSLGNFPYA